MHNYVCLFTEDFRNGVVDGLNRLDHVGLGHRGELDTPIDRPHLVRELRLREGRKGPVGVRGQVLDEDEPGDPGVSLLLGGLGQLLLVHHDGDLGLLVGKLEDNRRGRLVLLRGVRAKAALNDLTRRRDGRNLVGFRSSKKERVEKTAVDEVLQVGRVVDGLPTGVGDVEKADS